MNELFAHMPFGPAATDAAWAILVHGGAGDRPPEPGWTEGCEAAAGAGASILRAGGSALDAVEQAVRVLEDNPLFNAGTGAALNEAGLIELDAAIMEGSEMRVGAVCALPPFRNPILIARSVLETGEHVLYAGEGAASFARSAGFAPVTSAELSTARARRSWEAFRALHKTGLSAGTVGAVARDVSARCAAATSTGGVVGKRLGRVGDSPIPGAGTYADEHGAASATGHGEFILRACLTKRVVDGLIALDTPVSAAERSLAFLLDHLGGRAGIIVVDAHGRLGLARSTQQMPWAAWTSERIGPVSG
jgi:L-asparaginase / beta-aspartyl-peptidase